MAPLALNLSGGLGRNAKNYENHMMQTKTLFRWEQDGQGGDHGTLVLWPNTHREMRLIVADFGKANALCMGINGVTKEAYTAGRRSMQAEVAGLAA